MYYESLSKDMLPDGFRVARIHLSGHLWISETDSFPTRAAAQEHVDRMNSVARPGAIPTPYVVWHRDDDIKQIRRENHANKII